MAEVMQGSLLFFREAKGVFSYDLINPTVFVLNNPTTNLVPPVARNCLICPFSYILRKSQLLCL